MWMIRTLIHNVKANKLLISAFLIGLGIGLGHASVVTGGKDRQIQELEWKLEQCRSDKTSSYIPKVRKKPGGESYE